MYFSNRISNTFTEEVLNRLYRSSASLAGQKHLEKKVKEINQRLSANFEKADCKQEISKQLNYDNLTNHQILLIKGEKYANKLHNLSQNKIQRETEKKNREEMYKKALNLIKTEENAILAENIRKLNRKFLKKVKKLEKNTLNQIKEMKLQFIRQIESSKLQKKEKLFEKEMLESTQSRFNTSNGFNSSLSKTQKLSTDPIFECRSQIAQNLEKLEQNKEKIKNLKKKFATYPN